MICGPATPRERKYLCITPFRFPAGSFAYGRKAFIFKGIRMGNGHKVLLKWLMGHASSIEESRQVAQEPFIRLSFQIHHVRVMSLRVIHF